MMAKSLVHLYFFLSFIFVCSASSVAVVVKDTAKKITYQGSLHDGIESFYNIPFGEDVAGEKRFSAPVLRKIAPGTTINATSPGPNCPQQKVPVADFPFFSNVTNVSENCLNLRVDRVANNHAGTNRSLPVMVYIYGGAYSIGQAYDQIYTPTGLLLGAAAKKTPVIYVAMNYRLNIFGFAALDALGKEGNTNVGLLDQIAALQWVKDNIRAFGGDPDNVTVFGESAGATSIGLLMTAYGGKRPALFQRAIMQSDGPITHAVYGNFSSRSSTMAVAKAMKCPLSPSEATLKCLRSASLASLFNATLAYSMEAYPPLGWDAFGPYVDGSFMPAPPSDLIRQGKFVKGVATIMGWNRNDNSLFTSPDIKNETGVYAQLASSYGLNKATIARTLELYPASEFAARDNMSGSYYRASRVARDLDGVCPAILFTRAISQHSPNAQNVFMFQLDQTPLTAQFRQHGHAYYGVSHFSDIFYAFNEVSGFKNAIGATESDVKLAGRMSGSWTAFAAGKPLGSKQGREANATLDDWAPAFGPKGQVNIFAIRGGKEGNVPINKDTKHVGLDRLLERCQFMTTKNVYAQMET